ncbi:MAG: VWA domain-containing protein [Deltaproteobacteria bacterium]|nr:MAG: VWA domain-containing protein [Deltaproteobacteria bacterium]
MIRTSVLAAALLASSCSSGAQYAQAVVALVDVSGTYADQRPEVVGVIRKGLLPKLTPGDTLIVIRIGSESYTRANVEASMTLDVRPSRANAQKLALANTLEAFSRKPMRTAHTDIRGAMMLGAEYLRETNAGRRTMVIFSDMEEDLPRGVKREMAPDELKGVRVLAMNVKRLGPDNANPMAYRARLASWEKQLTSHGAREFKIVLEPEKLADLLDEG